MIRKEVKFVSESAKFRLSSDGNMMTLASTSPRAYSGIISFPLEDAEQLIADLTGLIKELNDARNV